MVHVSALSFSLCVCACICVLFTRKNRKSCSLAILRICCAAPSFLFFFELDEQEKQKKEESSSSRRGERKPTRYGIVEGRGVASSRLLMLWENKQKNTKNYVLTEKPKSSRATCAFLSLCSALSLRVSSVVFQKVWI